MSSSPVVIVLAAGLGSRYAGPRHKLAEPFGASTVLGQTVGRAIASGLPVVVVTTPALVDDAKHWVARRDIVVLTGPQGPGAGGMGDSIAAGVSARAGAGGWLILPGDMPLVRPDSLNAVAAQLGQHPVCFAQFHGRRGHPVGFSAELYSDLVRLSGPDGARRVLARYPAHALELDDPGVLEDLDTVDDMARMQAAADDGRPLSTF